MTPPAASEASAETTALSSNVSASSRLAEIHFLTLVNQLFSSARKSASQSANRIPPLSFDDYSTVNKVKDV